MGKRLPKGEFFRHQRLYNNLAHLKKDLKKDNDFFIIVDGREGSGKSTLACQVAKDFDPSFDADRMTLSPEEFTKAVIKAEKYQAVVFDEGYSGLYSRQAMTQVNTMLIKMIAEIRQKNLVVIIVMPSFFDLERYIAIHRSVCLLHVYKKKMKRGYFMFFSERRKKFLYLYGKKTYDYSKQKANFVGKFPSLLPINEAEYRKKKLEALEKRLPKDDKEEEKANPKLERLGSYLGRICTFLYDNNMMKQRQIERIMGCEGSGHVSRWIKTTRLQAVVDGTSKGIIDTTKEGIKQEASAINS